MPARTLHTWIARHIAVRTRLAQVGVSSLLFLMVVTRKHSLAEAARFSGGHKSQCSQFLRTHSSVAITTLQHLSIKQAKRWSKTLNHLSQQQLPWKIALLIESPLQHRASLHPENAKKFHHGKGFVIGHQWTKIVLIITDMLIPLPPIPF
jgi:hypothetical protein